MASNLTKKEGGFVKDYVKTGNGTLAAKRNYKVKNDNTAAAIASENLRKPKIIEAVKRIADYFPDATLAKIHNEQLKSSRHAKLYFDIDDEDERIEEVCKKLGVELLYIKISKDKTGKTANVKAPDFFFRDLALDKAYKLKGHYDDKQSVTKNLIIMVTGETANRYGIIANQKPS